MNPALIPLLISGAGELVKTINGLRQAARQAGELTPEQDAAYAAQLATMFSQDHWQPRD